MLLPQGRRNLREVTIKRKVFMKTLSSNGTPVRIQQATGEQTEKQKSFFEVGGRPALDTVMAKNLQN